MKLPLLVTLTILPCLAFAQSTTDNSNSSCSQCGSKDWHHHHHPSPDEQLAWLTTKLSLSDTQQGQIKPLLVSKDEKAKAIYEDTSLTDDQKHQQMAALHQDTDKQIESYLTPEQVQTFEQMHQQHDS